MRALDSNSKKQSTSTVSPVPKPPKVDGLGVQGSRPHDVLRSHDSLTATHPGDKHEREADKAADTVMSNRRPSLNSGHASQNNSSLSSTRAGAAFGAPLESDTRALMETRFGHDFSQVRVHTDEKAAASARDVHARAYAVGDDIVFGKGLYHPSAASSQHLIAHELAHVVQQRQTGQKAIARQLEYENTGRNITRANVEQNLSASYWEQKVMGVFDYQPWTDRLSKDPEERDAVLSLLWARQPSPQFTIPVVIDVHIAARTKTIGQQLLYRFTFAPRDAKVANSKPSAKVEFIGAGTGTSAIVPSKPRADYSPAQNFSLIDEPYPNYFDKNVEEKKYLFNWIEKQAPVKFSQLIKVKTTTTKAKTTTTTETSFFVEGEKGKDGYVSRIAVRYLGSFKPGLFLTRADYRSKDYADVLLERSQTQPDEVVKDKLGKVNLPTGISAQEAFAVKYYIWQYFGSYTMGTSTTKLGGTRNAEVDAIVLIPNSPTKVLYTFRFRANNDVDSERVGEMGTGATQINPEKLDIARAPEYADKAKDPKTFKAWLKIRYPQVTVAGTTVEEMRTNINTEAEAKAEKPEWFKNYDIKVLNVDDAKKRLKSVHKYAEEQVADLKEYLPRELKVLEVSLQTMARKILDLIKQTRMIRQKVSIVRQPDKTFIEQPNVGGRALSNKTVIMFDSGLRAGDPVQFVGGASEGVLPEQSKLYTHELGHVVDKTSTRKKFDEFIAKHGIKPFTGYAKAKVAAGEPHEFFAEAFSLYQTDPEWMLTNHPLLHAWFETLAKTGKPPVK